MNNKRKICLCLAVPLISFAVLYGGGYAAQFIKNYKIWTSAGGTPGSSSPVKPTLNAIACFKAAFSFPYGIIGCGICITTVLLLVFCLFRMGRSDGGVPDKERNFVYSNKGTYGTSGFMSEKEMKTVFNLTHDLKNCSGTVLGLYDGKYICVPQNGRLNKNIAVYGASGSTATQFIIWEYQQGLRTAPDEQIADRRYRAKIAGTPAETAYKNILSNIRKYISDPQYSGNTQNLYGFVQLTSGSTSKEQEIICFYGETPKLLEKGYIEVYKKDTDGNSLDGAEFSVYNSSGAYVTKIGPTVNGYARSAEITLGTYTVVETKFPQNYRKYDKDTWTVTLNSGSAKFTINAVNEIVPGACRIIKASEDGVIAGVNFRITGNGTDETAKTNENGEIIFSSLKPGRYTVTEDTEDKYILQSM